MDKLIMKFQIFIDNSKVSDMSGPYGAATFIPFTGKVESELFTGEILPGAADIQVENPAGCRHMCAEYMFRGKDSAGKDCYLFVENNGYFTIAKLSFVNKGDVTLMGCSQGGFVSALTGAELGGKIRRLILFYPALCIPDDARSGKMMFAKFDPQNIPEVIHCGPMKLGKEYAQSVLDVDAVEAICSYDGPVLIVHGTKDEIVDCSYARKAAEAYSNAELVIIPDGKHGFSKEHDKIALEAVERFVKE
ncbi:MAG: DUF3237 family protein [Lachnospiraceae bacterium]|nr:DUF3237 family protein [Lachnospiraceae bacterium]